MQYLLMEYVNEAGWPVLSPKEQQQWIALVRGYVAALKEAGVLQGFKGLQPSSTATTVRTRDDKLSVLDGPYADSKEQFAGYYLIDVPDLDAALAWAARSPTALHGVVEVRPLFAGAL